MTTEVSSNSDPSAPNEITEDNPDGGCHIYRYGYYAAGITIVGKDVSQYLKWNEANTVLHIW